MQFVGPRFSVVKQSIFSLSSLLQTVVHRPFYVVLKETD